MTLKALYDSVNAMMAQLGASGELHPRDATVTAVMDALHDIDGGAWSDKVIVDKALGLTELVRVAEAIERAKTLPEPPKGE